MRKLLVIVLCLFAYAALSHNALALSEPDTEAFLDANFNLQTEYNNVLCVGGGASCPSEITTTVPCLTETCTHQPQNYTVQDTFNSIQAASDAAVPGDLIIIMPGTWNGVAVEEKNGADGAYIHFLGWGEPGTIVVDAPQDSGIRHHFYFIDTDYYIIQNIAFEDSPDGAGIFFSGYFSATGQFSHHLIVMDVYSHDNYKWGLHSTQASYMVIQDSVFTGSEDEHGAYISGGGDHILVRRNVFQGNNASGFQANADPQSATAELFYYLQNTTGDTCGWTEADVEFTGEATWDDIKACYDSQGLPDLGEFIDDGITSDLIVEHNVMNNNGSAGGAAINLASVRQSKIRNNVIYGNLAGSIACWDNNYADDKGLTSSNFGCHNTTIVNNTIVEEAGNRSSFILMNDAEDMTVYNNIIVRERSDAYEISARSGQGLRSAANYYYALDIFDSPGTIIIDTDPGSGSITGFTLAQALTNFEDANSNEWMDLSGSWPQLAPNRPDFRPLPGSVLVTMANPSYMPVTDFLGYLRSDNTAGAYNVSDGSTPVTATPGGPTVTPGAPTATSTPLNTPIAGNELISNGSFEADTAGDNIPDDWSGKNLTGDKQKCNKDKDGDGIPDKIVAVDGECAVQMKGGIAENSKFIQKPDVTGLVSGDTLIMSVYIQTKNAAVGGSVAFKGKYADDTTKFKEQIEIAPGTAAFNQFVTNPLGLADGVLKLKVQFSYKGASGKYYIDLMSLVQQAGTINSLSSSRLGK